MVGILRTWSLLMRKTLPSISSIERLSVATDSSVSRWGSPNPTPIPTPAAPKPGVLTMLAMLAMLTMLPERARPPRLSRPTPPICFFWQVETSYAWLNTSTL